MWCSTISKLEKLVSQKRSTSCRTWLLWVESLEIQTIPIQALCQTSCNPTSDKDTLNSFRTRDKSGCTADLFSLSDWHPGIENFIVNRETMIILSLCEVALAILIPLNYNRTINII
jgi:hypothetical protein